MPSAPLSNEAALLNRHSCCVTSRYDHVYHLRPDPIALFEYACALTRPDVEIPQRYPLVGITFVEE